MSGFGTKGLLDFSNPSELSSSEIVKCVAERGTLMRGQVRKCSCAEFCL